MLPISPGEKVGIREVSLNRGTGTLIYDYDEAKPDRVERLTLVWNTADRVYILSGPLGERLAVAVANAIE